MSKKLGLALGSGGGWSIAGLGVIKALEKHGIKIDYLAGSSMGALITTAYASSFAGPETVQKIEEMLENTKLRDALKFSFRHKYGFLSPDNIGQNFVKQLGKENFEELPIPVKVVATDFQTGEPVIFDQGPIAPAISGSCSMTLLFAPHHYQGKLLTDGGVSMMIPISLLKEMGADVIVAVDVSSKRYLTRIDPNWTPWHHLVTKFIPPLHYITNRRFRNTTSQLIDLLFANLTKAQLQACPPDFLVSLNVSHMDQFAFSKTKEFVKEGYQATEKIIPDLKKMLE